jgi:hypothetical protein
MSGTYPTLQLGPATYQVSVAVTGGQLVMADASNAGMVKPTTGAVAGVIGVALTDAVPVGSGSNLNYATARYETAVAYGPAEVVLTVASGGTALLFGDLVVAAAAGQCSKGTTPTYDLIVGRCTEPGGIALGASGRVRLA